MRHVHETSAVCTPALRGAKSDAQVVAAAVEAQVLLLLLRDAPVVEQAQAGQVAAALQEVQHRAPGEAQGLRRAHVAPQRQRHQLVAGGAQGLHVLVLVAERSCEAASRKARCHRRTERQKTGVVAYTGKTKA